MNTTPTNSLAPPTTWNDDIRHPVINEVDWTMAVLLGLMTVYSIIFNCAMFYEFWLKFRGKINVSFYIYFHLLGSDLILCCLCAPFSIFTHSMGRLPFVAALIHESVILNFYCNVSGFLYNVVSKTTVQLIFLLTFDRWLTIVYPQVHRQWATVHRYRVAIVTLWSLSVVGSLSPFFAAKFYFFQHKFISLCTWDFTATLGVRQQRDKWLYLFLYVVYVILPIVIPLLLTIFFAVTVIRRLHSIKRKDYRRNRRTSKVSYAANTVTFITIFHIASYAIWYFVITSALLSLLEIIPIIQMDSAFKNHVFTSYPFGAYINAAANPVFLYFRILKKKMSFTKRKKDVPKKVAVVSVGVAVKGERATATLVNKCNKTGGTCEAVEIVAFSARAERVSRVSIAHRVIDRMNSAHKILRNFTRTISFKEQANCEVIENDCVVIQNDRHSAVIVEPASRRRAVDSDEGITLNSINIRNITFDESSPELKQMNTTDGRQIPLNCQRTENSILSSTEDNVIVYMKNTETFFMPLIPEIMQTPKIVNVNLEPQKIPSCPKTQIRDVSEGSNSLEVTVNTTNYGEGKDSQKQKVDDNIEIQTVQLLPIRVPRPCNQISKHRL